MKKLILRALFYFVLFFVLAVSSGISIFGVDTAFGYTSKPDRERQDSGDDAGDTDNGEEGEDGGESGDSGGDTPTGSATVIIEADRPLKTEGTSDTGALGGSGGKATTSPHGGSGGSASSTSSSNSSCTKYEAELKSYYEKFLVYDDSENIYQELWDLDVMTQGRSSDKEAYTETLGAEYTKSGNAETFDHTVDPYTDYPLESSSTGRWWMGLAEFIADNFNPGSSSLQARLSSKEYAQLLSLYYDLKTDWQSYKSALNDFNKAGCR